MRVPLLSLLALLFLAATLPAAEKPNIVLIVSDDQGYRDLGCYGSTEARTPHLDRLAREGIRLSSFYVAWPACTPSRAALLTGRYPQRNGTYDMIRNDRVDDGHRYSPQEYAVSPERILGTDVREVFLSQVLAKAGYRCGCFGKWDGGQLKRFLPLQRGFDDFYGFTNTGIDYFTHERYGVPSMRRGNQPTTQDRGTYATDLFRREAVSFLEENRERPFFLYLPFNAPHGASNLDAEIRGTVQATEKYLRQYPAASTRRGERRRSYLAAVTCMDDAIGEVLDLLDRCQLADNTLVIFLSDNGGSGIADNQPLRGGKGSLYEGGIRVPCIVRFPGRVPAGKTSDELLTALDVFPTVLAAAGVSLPKDVVLDGFDMLPLLAGKRPSGRQEMFWQRQSQRAARVGTWKWVAGENGGLFDLAEDVGETRDLSAKRPEILKRLVTRFAAWRKEMDTAEPRGPFRDY